MQRALLALALLVACGGNPPHAEVPAAPSRLTVPALDGGTIDIARYRGRIVVLHFFTTWDGGSHNDVQQLREAPDTVVIGIALDPDGRRLIAPWRKAMDVHYLIGLGAAELATNVAAARSVPTTVILDTAGVVRARFDRPLRPGELQAAIERVR
jgi:peroxiredoxin